MKLDRHQRHAIIAGRHPKIAGKGECPVDAGVEIALTTRVAIRVDRIRIPRGGGWSLKYTVIDHRDSFLAPTGHKVALDEKGNALPMSEAEAHGLTSDPRDPLDAGVYVGREYQTVVDMRARLKTAERPGSQSQRDTQILSFKERLRETMAGLDPLGQAALLARLERELAAAIAVEDQAA